MLPDVTLLVAVTLSARFSTLLLPFTPGPSHSSVLCAAGCITLYDCGTSTLLLPPTLTATLRLLPTLTLLESGLYSYL